MARRPPHVPHAAKPTLRPQVTTLWDYPSQSYGTGQQGNPHYKGVTPSYVIWNLLTRYTQPNDLLVDVMAGSGTSLDVARDMGRRALGYDLNVTRPDIFRVDARKLPLEDNKADFVFVDPPYSDHVDYSDDPRCLGRLNASDPAYYQGMEQVIREMHRVLRPDRYAALYVGDSLEKGKVFHPIGVEMFLRLRQVFTPVDHIIVTRHNKTLEMGNYRMAAEEENFFLRGFLHLFILYKEPAPGTEARRRTVGPPVPPPPLSAATPATDTPPAAPSRAPGGHPLVPARSARGPRKPQGRRR